jgi:hypothetical protein
MASPHSHNPFNWSAVRPLLGVPMADVRLQDLFAQAGLVLASVAKPLLIGLVSPGPPIAPAWEVDLSPSHHVRLRFKPAGEVGAGQVQDTTCVLAAVTWFLDGQEPGSRFAGALPAGLDTGTDPDGARQRIGRPPTDEEIGDPTDTGYMAWYDAQPVLHVVFTQAPRRLLRVNCFLQA